MPEIVGRLRTPRLAAAPASPVVGEVYYDTSTNILYWWNGTAWISASGSAGVDLVYNGSFPANTPYTDGDIVVSGGVAYMCVRPTAAAPTPWAQAGAGDLVYNGAFPSNTPYTDGDIVLQNGIAYLCVRPTSAAPTPWPRANDVSYYGISLPTSPADGQEAILVDSVNASTYQWHFRYNAGSSSAYKWEFVGGTSAFVEVGAQEITAGAVNTQQDLATVGPQFVIPRDGIYLVEISARIDKGTAGGWATATAYILDNGTLANPVVQIYANVYNYSATPVPYVTGSDRGRLVVLSGHTLKMVYAIHALDNAGQQVYFQRRRLTITPVKVS